MKYQVLGSYARPVCNSCETTSEDYCTAHPIQTDGIIYSGANLPCSGIHTCDDLTVAIQKLDEQLCIINQKLYNLTTTTTTTLII